MITIPASVKIFIGSAPIDMRKSIDGLMASEAAPPSDGILRLWLYVSTWNARMTFTAKGCELEWEG